MTADHSGRAQVDDTVAAIDAAIGCQQCREPLGESPSDEFCSPRCQAQWHAARSVPLTTYREPVDLAAHYSNQVEGRSPDTTPFSDAGEPCDCELCRHRRAWMRGRLAHATLRQAQAYLSLDLAGDLATWLSGGTGEPAVVMTPALERMWAGLAQPYAGPREGRRDR